MELSEQIISVYGGENEDLLALLIADVDDLDYIGNRIVAYYKPSAKDLVKSLEGYLDGRLITVWQLHLDVVRMAHRTSCGEDSIAILAPLESKNKNKSSRDIRILNQNGGRNSFERTVIKCGIKSS